MGGRDFRYRLGSGGGLPAPVCGAPALAEAHLAYRGGGDDGAGADTPPAADAATNPRLLDANEQEPTRGLTHKKHHRYWSRRGRSRESQCTPAPSPCAFARPLGVRAHREVHSDQPELLPPGPRDANQVLGETLEDEQRDGVNERCRCLQVLRAGESQRLHAAFVRGQLHHLAPVLLATGGARRTGGLASRERARVPFAARWAEPAGRTSRRAREGDSHRAAAVENPRGCATHRCARSVERLTRTRTTRRTADGSGPRSLTASTVPRRRKTATASHPEERLGPSRAPLADGGMAPGMREPTNAALRADRRPHAGRRTGYARGWSTEGR